MKCPRSIGSMGAGKFMRSEQRLAAHKIPVVQRAASLLENFRATHHLCSRFNKSRISVSSVSCLVIAGVFGASDCMI
jgi:hypothetical protein